MQITSIFPRYNDIKHDLIARRIAYLYLIQKSASGRTEPSFRKDVGRSTIKSAFVPFIVWDERPFKAQEESSFSLFFGKNKLA